ncbi:sensor histidine kinase [Oceanisphaera ostreae]|uniref:histidine kinase n=1 Tax=Oceanisphaera ostreae TaxID=914151 RepID=A0ABW3KE35_9GAMM
MPVDVQPSLSMTALVNAMPSGVVWLDGRGRVALVNPVAQSMLGEPLQGVAWPTVIERVFAPQPDDGLQVSLKDGRRIQLAISHIEGQPGQLIQLTDMTPTRAWVEQQSHAQRLAALGQMAATLAHQIRTPLSAAMLYGANLAAPHLSNRQRELFQQRLVARLNDIERQISDILLFARPDQAPLAGKLDLTVLLPECVEAASSLLVTKGAKLTLSNTMSGPTLVLANAHALQGIVLNLLENATEAGASELNVLLVAAPDNEVEIRVQDNGKGMDEYLLNKVFTPFFTTRSQGTGLGLAAVMAVMRAHQGRVTVQSVLGEGSCFSLFLPLAKVP